MPGGVGERAFQAEVTARTKAVRWEQAHHVPGTERKLLQPEREDAPSPGPQELVFDPKATRGSEGFNGERLQAHLRQQLL